MSLKHVSDRELQLYLEGKSLTNRKHVELHLTSCELCRQQLEAYRYVFAEFNAEPSRVFSPDFENLIIDKIQLAGRRAYRRRDSLFDSVAVLLAMGVMTGLFFILKGGNLLVRFFHVDWTSYGDIVNRMVMWSERLNISSEFIVTTGIIILLFMFSDKLFNFVQSKFSTSDSFLCT